LPEVSEYIIILLLTEFNLKRSIMKESLIFKKIRIHRAISVEEMIYLLFLSMSFII